MRKSIMAATFVPLFVAALVTAQAAGQAPNPPAQTPEMPQPPKATAQQPTTTLVGCLYREDQVPGRKPNVAERAGILEDYILADASTQASPVRLPERLAGPVRRHRAATCTKWRAHLTRS